MAILQAEAVARAAAAAAAAAADVCDRHLLCSSGYSRDMVWLVCHHLRPEAGLLAPSGDEDSVNLGDDVELGTRTSALTVLCEQGFPHEPRHAFAFAI